MTQNDLYIALAYGQIDEYNNMLFEYSGDIFTGINEKHDGGYYLFGSNNYNIYLFGILTIPGVEIVLNKNGSRVKVGLTGIWEINLSSLTPIASDIQIYKLDELLSANGDTKDLSCNYCLIDVIYSKLLSGGVSD